MSIPICAQSANETTSAPMAVISVSVHRQRPMIQLAASHAIPTRQQTMTAQHSMLRPSSSTGGTCLAIRERLRGRK